MKTPTQLKTHPKLGDGKRAILGSKAWYPWSHDSWSGPHSVEVTGIDLDPVGDHVKILFNDGDDCWIDPANLFSTKKNAEQHVKDWQRKQNEVSKVRKR